MSTEVIPGWWFLLGYLLVMAAAIVFCAGLESREKKFGHVESPWEGDAAVSHPRTNEGETA